jgi:hypothetical protein
MRGCKRRKRVNRADTTPEQQGSVLVMAVFVTFLLSAMGMALLFLSVNELKMNRANLNVKKAFYLAESGLDDGRSTLYNTNGSDDFVDNLQAAAGGDNTVNFDPDALTVTYDVNGNISGFAGYGDDEPLIDATAFGEGYYAAFLTNDPVDGVGTINTDPNDRVMITSVGAGPNNSMEIVHGIIKLQQIFPTYPPATITMLGPNPNFLGAKSTPKVYDGEDCGGLGIPDLWVPVVGVIGSAAEAAVEGQITPNPNYTSGDWTDEDTFSDLTDPADGAVDTGQGVIDPAWLNCVELKSMVEMVRMVADVECFNDSCVLPPSSPNRVVFVNGDWDIKASDPPGEGMILVTGEMAMHGTAEWSGLVYTIGEGLFTRYGSGNGSISGASMIVDIAGPDNIYGTDDDCNNDQPDGFSSVTYDERGGGSSDTTYCTSDFAGLDLVQPYTIEQFRQR